MKEKPAPSGETRGTCQRSLDPHTIAWCNSYHRYAPHDVGWKPVAPEVVGTTFEEALENFPPEDNIAAEGTDCTCIIQRYPTVGCPAHKPAPGEILGTCDKHAEPHLTSECEFPKYYDWKPISKEVTPNDGRKYQRGSDVTGVHRAVEQTSEVAPREAVTREPGRMPEYPGLGTDGWVEIRRGFGIFEMSTLQRGQFVTENGKRDGGYIVWRLLGDDAPGEAVGRPDKSPIPERYETDVADFKRRELRAMAKYASEAVGRETRGELAQAVIRKLNAEIEVLRADCVRLNSELSILRRERDQLLICIGESDDCPTAVLATMSTKLQDAESQVRELTAQVKAHRESDQDRDRLVRELDQALFGPNTARQARLCDLAKTVPGLVAELRATIERLEGDVQTRNALIRGLIDVAEGRTEWTPEYAAGLRELDASLF